MYEPREDSYLLKKNVKEHSKGIVLDMGTGSGVQALEAAESKKVVKVYAVDVDKEVIDYCKENIDNKKIDFFVSDLFSVFKINKRLKDIKFDTIIFNPPYLPEEPRLKDITLDGGRKGYELICRFVNEATGYLKPTTKILLLFSSLTGKEKLENYLVKKRFKFKELDKKHIFFEDLFIYLVEPENEA